MWRRVKMISPKHLMSIKLSRYRKRKKNYKAVSLRWNSLSQATHQVSRERRLSAWWPNTRKASKCTLRRSQLSRKAPRRNKQLKSTKISQRKKLPLRSALKLGTSQRKFYPSTKNSRPCLVPPLIVSSRRLRSSLRKFSSWLQARINLTLQRTSKSSCSSWMCCLGKTWTLTVCQAMNSLSLV